MIIPFFASCVFDLAILLISFVLQIIESAIVKCRKPDPKIYQMCLDRLKLSPEQTVFLDDLGMNLKTANKMGIHTIKVRID